MAWAVLWKQKPQRRRSRIANGRRKRHVCIRGPFRFFKRFQRKVVHVLYSLVVLIVAGERGTNSSLPED
jgi:hypothetical protein